MSPTIRTDAADKARGKVLFGMDIERPKMLWGALVLAPATHGRLTSVDLAPARRLPGVTAIGSADLANLLDVTRTDPEHPVFPAEEIHYRNQPVAAVAAPTLERAREAARAVRVTCEELPTAQSVEEGAQPAPEVIAHVHARHGDIEAAFHNADLVLTETYRTSGVCQVALEPHACIAEVRPDGTWYVQSSTQSPFGAREDIASRLGLAEHRVVVDGTWVGGGFGGKGSAFIEPYALLLARASGSPVRLALTYQEEFVLGHSTLPSFMRISSAVRSGRVVGRRVLWRLDAGASLPGRDFATGYGIGFISGPYRIPAVELEGFALRTHKPALGPHRAPLAPQCAFVAESHMDHLAARLGVDSAAFRRAHAWVEGDQTVLGQRVRAFALARCLELAESRAREWRSDRRPNHGVGVGAGFWSTGTGAGGEARLRLAPSGLTILQGEREIGSGSVIRGLSAVAERVLGLSREFIHVDYADTSSGPFDSGVWGSRTLGALGQAVGQAARALLETLSRRVHAAAETVHLEAVGAEVHVVAAGRSIALRTLLSAEELATGGLDAEGKHYGTSGMIDPSRVIEGNFFPYTDFAGAAHVAEVAVDPDTATVKVVRYAAFHDVGTVVDPPTARAQVEGGIVMGLGTALTEEAFWGADGRLLNPNLLDYRVPTFGEVPPIEVVFVEGYLGAGPFGAKGLGEPPIVPVPSTIANAIRDATGAELTELPMTGERVARALKLL
jgi:CO/xanthine dehydrogenase Mo-binding subunit